jgi:catechol 2,3-dioxygenase-like lactoylglutathione lyase family enzyme
MPSARPPWLFRVIVPVADVDRSVEFYGAVLGLTGARISPGRHYFDCGGTILACFDPRADGDDFEAEPNRGHLYLAVEDLDDCYARARQAGCLWI